MRDALRAEWTKLRFKGGLSVPLVVAFALTVAGLLLPAHGSPDPVQLRLLGIRFGQAAVVAAGVRIVADGLTGITLLAVPRRIVLLTTKALLLAACVVPVAVLGVAGAVVGLPFSGALLRAATGSILYLILIGLLGVGTAALVRSAATAAGLVLGLLYLAPIVAELITNEHWRNAVVRATPATAAQSLATTVDVHGLILKPWPALAVTAAWTLAVLAAGAWAFHRRDA